MRLLKNLITLLTVMTALTLQAVELSCTHCGKAISGKYVTLEGKAYHQTCYRDHIQPRCDQCGDVIEGKYTILDGKKYHEDCYTEHIALRCDVCNDPLLGKYYTDFWGNSFHASHDDEYPKCNSCGRLICDELTGGGFSLGDGRFSCSICNETAVEGTFLLESSRDYVRTLLQSNGLLNLPADIPITLVDRWELRRMSSSYSDAMNGFTQHNIQTRNGQVISSSSHIYILSNLPLTMFKAVLAHEMMHVYLFQRDLDLPSHITEGFCNLGSELVYRDIPSEYARFRLETMWEDRDPDYGEGYRQMSRRLEAGGWRRLLDDLPRLR